jgi:hypothetical protein
MENFTTEELAQARIIAARSKFWTPDVEKLLRKWKRQIIERQFIHKKGERLDHVMYYIFGIPTSILLGIVSAGVIATFQNCDTCDQGDKCSSDEWIRLVIGFIGIISTVLSAITTFLDFGGKREKHKTAIDDYDNIIRKIDSILQTSIVARGDPIVIISEIRNMYDEIGKNSPIMPSSYYKNLEYKYIGDTEIPLSDLSDRKRLKPPSPEDVEKLGITAKTLSSSKLADILLKNIEKQEKTFAKRKKRIDKANDYDTDDEKEVTIGIDLDQTRAEDLLEDKKRKMIHDSLAKALEFELQRLYE